MDQLKAMKQALEALEDVVVAHRYESGTPVKAITVLRQAIEQAEQAQPVAWYHEEMDCAYTAAELDGEAIDGLVPLYTSPPQRNPLTDEQIDKVTDAQWSSNNHKPIYAAHRAFARAIEAAHGIKGDA